MANHKNFERDDLSWNEVRSNNSGNFAPILIEDDGKQFGILGINRSDCVIWKFGTKRKLVYLVPASSEVAKFMHNSYRNEYRNEYRRNRCRIVGEDGSFVFCPEKYKCNACPFGISWENRKPGLISLDGLADDGYEPSINEPIIQQIEESEEIERIKTSLYKEKPILVKVLDLLYEGKKSEEIAQILGIKTRAVTTYRKMIRDIVKRYLQDNE